MDPARVVAGGDEEVLDPLRDGEMAAERRSADREPPRERGRELGPAEARRALLAPTARARAEREVVAEEVHPRADRPVVVRGVERPGCRARPAARARARARRVQVHDVRLQPRRAPSRSVGQPGRRLAIGLPGSLKTVGRLKTKITRTPSSTRLGELVGRQSPSTPAPERRTVTRWPRRTSALAIWRGRIVPPPSSAQPDIVKTTFSPSPKPSSASTRRSSSSSVSRQRSRKSARPRASGVSSPFA